VQPEEVVGVVPVPARMQAAVDDDHARVAPRQHLIGEGKAGQPGPDDYVISFEHGAHLGLLTRVGIEALAVGRKGARRRLPARDETPGLGLSLRRDSAGSPSSARLNGSEFGSLRR
jgi:hypothetical protein